MTVPPPRVLAAAERAVRRVPPLWPLSASVAVNPFLGHTNDDLAVAAVRLGRVAGIRVTMPRAWYAERIARGAISEVDLTAALDASPRPFKAGIAGLRRAARDRDPVPRRALNVADLAAGATGTDWPGLFADRFGVFASGYFDEGQALWQASREGGAYAAWREAALHDLTPEIAGLPEFARHVSLTPPDADGAILQAVKTLDVDEGALESYFHALLMTLGGWAQLGRYKLWQAELAGGSDTTGLELLAIRLVIEVALMRHAGNVIEEPWRKALDAHAAPLKPGTDEIVDAILQEAAERAAQRHLGERVAKGVARPVVDRPRVTAAFCIDVRSEVFRRALEAMDPAIRTIGFAGFFGIGASHRGFASDIAEHRLPVLLNPALQSRAGTDAVADKDRAARYVARARRAWGRFKLAAVSSFAFVEAMGPVYAVRLARDALGLTRRAPPNDPAPTLVTPLGLAERIAMAEAVLNAMSLTSRFARLVLFVGHGANVVNNPHASALHCGACGGHSGEVNARLLASLLNDHEVRQGLAERGLEIPADTLFLAGLHDTTTDAVFLYTEDVDTSEHRDDLVFARSALEAAGQATRAERALRLPRTGPGCLGIKRRSRDWAETRPEWALAGCSAFIAAPRGRTEGRSLEGRAFLHDYDWREDKDFSVLNLIMTAPVVVASWISLQYYGSTVAPHLFGGGNKLIHNVTGGIGVVEGNGGVLRAGLPWQSVHDGARLVHEPLRLTVVIDAPRAAMTDILARHADVKTLFDNRWLHLLAFDEKGEITWRYAGNLEWVTANPFTVPERKVEVA